MDLNGEVRSKVEKLAFKTAALMHFSVKTVKNAEMQVTGLVFQLTKLR